MGFRLKIHRPSKTTDEPTDVIAWVTVYRVILLSDQI